MVTLTLYPILEPSESLVGMLTITLFALRMQHEVHIVLPLLCFSFSQWVSRIVDRNRSVMRDIQSNNRREVRSRSLAQCQHHTTSLSKEAEKSNHEYTYLIP